MTARAKPAKSPRPAAPRPFTVFLDRDGVFDVTPRLVVASWKAFHWLPGVKAAFARLNQPFIRTCLATNQPFVGAGLLPERRLMLIHAQMKWELEQTGGRLDRIEAAFAPVFLPNRRRKPRPGMLEDGAAALAAQGWAFDKARAVMVGDRIVDAEAGAAFGIPAILLCTTMLRAELAGLVAERGLTNVTIVDDLEQAVTIILERCHAP